MSQSGRQNPGLWTWALSTCLQEVYNKCSRIESYILDQSLMFIKLVYDCAQSTKQINCVIKTAKLDLGNTCDYCNIMHTVTTQRNPSIDSWGSSSGTKCVAWLIIGERKPIRQTPGYPPLLQIMSSHRQTNGRVSSNFKTKNETTYNQVWRTKI